MRTPFPEPRVTPEFIAYWRVDAERLAQIPEQYSGHVGRALLALLDAVDAPDADDHGTPSLLGDLT